VRLPLVAALVWVVVWAVFARQAPYHYPHWLPMAVALGLAALWLRAEEMVRPSQRRLVLAVTAGVVAAAWVFCMPLPAFDPPRRTPLHVFPDRLRRLDNPAYASIADLVTVLRNASKAEDGVLVAASSTILNPDIVGSAERSLFGRRGARLRILPSPQVDSEGVVPTDLLLAAKFVVVAEPFQYHLRPTDQKVVRILVDAFNDGWPITGDFELLPQRFPLPEPGREIRIYRRLRASSPEVAQDASRRIDEFVLGKFVNGATWVADSALPSQVRRTAAGATRAQLHPVQASSGRQTHLMLAGFEGETVALSGHVWFYDSRCAGIEIIAVTGRADAREERSLGTFTPSSNDARLEATLRLQGRSLTLDIRSAPASPENVNFCTVVLRDLQARSLP
jgi:hypothetical protein